MIYQPRNVQPSGVSIDGLLDNTFTMEIQTNSYVSAYQLLIVDFDNNEIYTGSKTTLTNYAYNGDTLEIPVSASAVALSNGTNYKWRVRLYQPTADMLITYGLVQATSTTTTIYLQPNINIKAGMAITINSQTKTISSYNSDTGMAVVSSAFSSAPAVGTQYKIYSDFIETVPDYIVYARQTPAVAISNVPSSLTLKYHTFQGTYTQSDNVPIVYHQFDLYTRNDDGTISLVTSSDKVYSANLSYTYDSFRTGNKYLIQMTVENDMGVITTTDMYEFNVSYDIVEYLQQPLASFDDKNNAVKVSWVTPVENEATSFRSDVATGIIQDNNNTLTQATFEPGQSIGEGDVVQITNSDCELVIDGKSTQATRSGKNLFNKSITPIIASNGQTITELDTGVKISYTNSSSSNVVKYALYKLIDLTNYVGKVVRIKCDFSKSNENLAPRYCIGLCDVNGNNKTQESVSITSGETISFTVPTLDGTSIYLCVWLYCTYVTPIEKGDYVDFTDIIITMDNEDMTYEPYGVSPSPDYPSPIESITEISATVTGKNLFDENYYNDTSLYTGGKYFAYIKLPDSFKTKFYGNMTLKGNSQNLVFAFSTINFGSSNGRMLNNGTLNANIEYDFTNAENVYLVIGNSNNINIATDIPKIFNNYNIMVSKESATSYEEYKSNSLTIDLQGNELCSLPNGTKDELVVENGRAKIIKNVGKYNITGNEAWALSGTESQPYINFGNYVDNCKYPATSTELPNLLSNYYLQIARNNLYNGRITLSPSKALIIYDTVHNTSLANFKTWLKSAGATLYYQLATPTEIDLGDSAIPYIDGINYMHISSNMDTTFSLVYPHKTISGNAYDYTEFNPPGVKQTGTIKSYNAITGIGTLMPQYPFMYTPMQGDSYAVISNIYNVSGFSYLYNTPYNTVNSLYTHGYTATWATPDGLCVLPDDFNITLQFSPDGNFFYDQNGVYQEVVNLITTETDDANNEGEFTIKIDKNKLIFVQNPDISLELPFYTNTTQVFVLSSASVAQINNDYVWDDTATWTDTYTWVEGGTSLERVCNHWWKVQITNTGIKIEEIFPTT